MVKNYEENKEINNRLSLKDFDKPDLIENSESALPDFKGWSRKAKDDFIQERIHQILFSRQGWNGLTASEIGQLAKVSEPTARKYLEKLCSIREAYSLKRKANLTLYYPNGKPLHGFGRYRFEELPNIIEVTLARGPEERLFFHLTEKRHSILEGEKTEGGVLIPFNQVDKLIGSLKKLKNRIGEVEK